MVMADRSVLHMDPSDISITLSRVVRDVIQFVSDQKALGNTSLEISSVSRQITDTWERPFSAPPSPLSDFWSQGSERSLIWFIDAHPFSLEHESGGLLKKMILAMNLEPEKVFICSCQDLNLLEKKIKQVGPAFLILLGEKTAKQVTGVQKPMEAIQGQFTNCWGSQAIPIYHPKDLLTYPALKRPVWNALQSVMERAGLTK